MCQRYLAISLFTEFEPTYSNNDLSVNALSKLGSVNLHKIIIIQHDIYAIRWNTLTTQLIQWYVDSFWGALDIETSKPQFLIFLNIIYPKEQQRRGFKHFLKRSRYDKESITKVLEAMCASAKSKCLILTLKELLPITLYDVKEWFSYHKIYDSEKMRHELAERIFKTKGGRFAECLCMADVEHELNLIHQEFLKTKGYLYETTL